MKHSYAAKHLPTLSKYYQKTVRFLQYQIRRILTIPQTPHEIARAFAVGVFIGVMPAMGTAVALVIAFLLRLNKTATILGSLVVNPWTVVFFYGACYRVGRWFFKLPNPIDWKRIFTFDMGWHSELVKVAPPLLIGSFFVGLFSAAIGYALVWWMATRYQAARRHKYNKKHS